MKDSFDLVLPRMKEIDFQRQLVSMDRKHPGVAVIYGWEHVHWRALRTQIGWSTGGSGTMAKGWPDLTLVRRKDGRMIFAELKGDGGKVTPDETRVLELLTAVAAFNPLMGVYLWWPKDLDEITRILR